MSGAAAGPRGVECDQKQVTPTPAAAAHLFAAAFTSASTKPSRRWTITAEDEILVVTSVGFPHLYTLNPKHTWPISAERLRAIKREASDGNPSALCVLGMLCCLVCLFSKFYCVVISLAVLCCAVQARASSLV